MAGDDYQLLRHDVIFDVGEGNFARGVEIVDRELGRVIARLFICSAVYVALLLFCLFAVVGKIASDFTGYPPQAGHAPQWVVSIWPYFWIVIGPIAVCILIIFPFGEHIPCVRRQLRRWVTSFAPHIAKSMERYQSGDWHFVSEGEQVPLSLMQSAFHVLLAGDSDRKFWRSLPRARDGLAYPLDIRCRQFSGADGANASQGRFRLREEDEWLGGGDEVSFQNGLRQYFASVPNLDERWEETVLTVGRAGLRKGISQKAIISEIASALQAEGLSFPNLEAGESASTIKTRLQGRRGKQDITGYFVDKKSS